MKALLKMRQYDCLTFILLLALPAALHAQPAHSNVLLVLSDDTAPRMSARTATPTSKRPTEDLAPTLLEACGQKPLKEMTGRSFLRLLRGETHAGRQYVFAERGAHGSGLPTGTAPFDLGRVVIGRRYKLIYNALWQLPYQPVDFASGAVWKELRQMNQDGKLSAEVSRRYFSPTRPMFELFDLETDPSELSNLIDSPEHAAIARELKAALQQWMILERDFLPLPVPPPQRR